MREKWARRIALITGLLVLLLSVVFSVMQNPADVSIIVKYSEPVSTGRQQASVVIDPKRIAAGRQVYQQHNCVRCHSIAGQGNPRNPLDGVASRYDVAELREWIIGGETLQDELPAYALRVKQSYREMPADDLDALLAYMQSLRR